MLKDMGAFRFYKYFLNGSNSIPLKMNFLTVWNSIRLDANMVAESLFAFIYIMGYNLNINIPLASSPSTIRNTTKLGVFSFI